MCQKDGTTQRAHAGVVLPIVATADGCVQVMDNPSRTGSQPRLWVPTIGRTAMVRFEDAEILNDEEAIRGIGEQLDRLIKDE